MAVHLQFEGIRCFAEPQDAVIRPITLLVGENSSGKTTFLALCRIGYAIANRMQTAPLFNEPPFWLGAYDQIATHRSGRRGPAESFSVAIRLGIGASLSSLHYEYVSRGGQPVPRVRRLEAGGLVIQQTERNGKPPTVLMRGSQRKASFPFAPFWDGATQDPPALWGSLIAAEIEKVGGEGVFSRSDWDSIDRALQSIQQEFRRQPYAIAPIRTSPQRTYDPISTVPDPEGSHIPMLLASLSRSAQQGQWNTLQSALKRAGRLRSADAEKLRLEARRLHDDRRCTSNDHHVLALAIVSGARTLATDDNTLAADFKNKRIIDQPRGSIYRNPEKHGHLLRHTSSCGIAR